VGVKLAGRLLLMVRWMPDFMLLLGSSVATQAACGVCDVSDEYCVCVCVCVCASTCTLASDMLVMAFGHTFETLS
jgi:hypothetical protein